MTLGQQVAWPQPATWNLPRDRLRLTGDGPRASCAGLSRHTAPPAPLEASAVVPPARQRRRH
jgi:hypothetical protein